MIMCITVSLIIQYIGLLDQSVALVENKREIENLQEQVSAMSVQVLIKEVENEEYEDVIRGTQSHVIVIYNASISELKKQINETPSSQPVTVAKQDTLSDSEISLLGIVMIIICTKIMLWQIEQLIILLI